MTPGHSAQRAGLLKAGTGQLVHLGHLVNPHGPSGKPTELFQTSPVKPLPCKPKVHTLSFSGLYHITRKWLC